MAEPVWTTIQSALPRSRPRRFVHKADSSVNPRCSALLVVPTLRQHQQRSPPECATVPSPSFSSSPPVPPPHWTQPIPPGSSAGSRPFKAAAPILAAATNPLGYDSGSIYGGAFGHDYGDRHFRTELEFAIAPTRPPELSAATKPRSPSC